MEGPEKKFETEILQKKNVIAERIVELQYKKQPELWKPYGTAGRASLKNAHDSFFNSR